MKATILNTHGIFTSLEWKWKCTYVASIKSFTKADNRVKLYSEKNELEFLRLILILFYIFFIFITRAREMQFLNRIKTVPFKWASRSLSYKIYF